MPVDIIVPENKKIFSKQEIKEKAARGEFNLGMLSNLFEQYKDQIALVLPKHITPERMIRIAVSAASTTPRLLQCNPYTLCGAVVQSSLLGLEPNTVLGESFLIPFTNNKVRPAELQVQLIIGYPGKIKLVENTGNLLGLNRRAVREKDEFEFDDGLEPYVRHKYHHIPYKKRGPVIGYWAGVILKSGFKKIDFATVAEMEEHRDKFAMTRGTNGVFGVWVERFDEMSLKTMVHRVMKDIPKSTQAQTAWNLDERAEAGVGQRFSLDVPLDLHPEGGEPEGAEPEPLAEPQRKSEQPLPQPPSADTTYADEQQQGKSGAPKKPADTRQASLVG